MNRRAGAAIADDQLHPQLPLAARTEQSARLHEQSGNTTNYFPLRSANVLNQYKAIGLFPNVSAPVFNQPGGNVPAGFALTLANPNTGGTIYYTTNGTDPARVWFRRGRSGALVYTNGNPLVLNRGVIVNARVFNGKLERLVCGNFTVGSLGVPLRITELMYGPIGGSNYEFLEVQNIGADAAGRERLQFLRHHVCVSQRHDHPARRRAGAGEQWQPVRLGRALSGRDRVGYYGGNLNNGGERIAISTPVAIW